MKHNGRGHRERVVDNMKTQTARVLPSFDATKGLEIGLYSLGDYMPSPKTGHTISAEQRVNEFVKMAQLAEQAGLDVFQLGESHQQYFVSQAHMVILAAIARETSTIKLGSASTIISTADPVRVFEDAATVDLLSGGRMEIVAGRASRIGLFDLLGYDVRDYEALFEEKFDLLLRINENEEVTWAGQFRKPLNQARVIPRPNNERQGLPIWRAVGGAPGSALRAGHAGVPMYLANLAGPAELFKRSVDVYREAAAAAGHDPDRLPIAIAGLLYVREDRMQAYREYFPNVSNGVKLANGRAFPKRAFAEGMDKRNVLNVGDPELIIDKMLYQHELYNHQRYVAQIDLGGVDFDDIKKTIDILGEKIVPAVKKYTARNAE